MTETEKKLREKLNNEQLEVVLHREGTATVMAGAGSGKTHTLISRVALLVDEGVPADRILVVTFTNAAANELKDRAVKLSDDRCRNIIACTYHKFCNMVLRKYGSRIGVSGYTVLSTHEFKNMIDYVKSSDPLLNNTKGFPSAGMMADIISLMINKQISLRDILWTAKYSKYRNHENLIQMLIDKVAEYGRKNQKLTYDDLLLRMNELLLYDDICKAVALRFKYIMVDEFQDTNDLQEEIIRKIHRYNKNILVVGDISQSIYAFRGANVRNLQNFGEKMGDCTTYVLNENYRSTQQILDAANAVMNDNVRSWKYYDMVSANKLSGNKPVIMRSSDTYAESDDVIDLIEKYHEDGIPYSEIAIIERSSMESFSIENILNQKGIGYTKLGGMKFMDYDCVGDMFAYFGVIANAHDTLSWFRILKLHPNIGGTFAKRIADGCESDNFLTENKFKKHQFYPELCGLDTEIRRFREISDLMILFDTVKNFYFALRERTVKVSNMKDGAKEEALCEIERDKVVIDTLREMASKYKDLVQFIDDIVLDSAAESKKPEDMLTITTVHSAKGLEWSLVIILNTIEGCFSSRISPDEWGTPEDEEELRCFYVAMTRAKKHLYLMAPYIKITYAGAEEAMLTHYLTESDKFELKENDIKWD